jgi:formamidopyrimidine-DNA glycosylase
MPELPEVEMYRRYFEETALNQKISAIEIYHPKVLDGQEQDFRELLIGEQFKSSGRWGKNLFLQTQNDYIVFMHFGMTGTLDYYNASVETPKYARVVFCFENEFNLAYISKRMFGRLGVVSSIAQYVASKALGKDALDISVDQFTEALAGKNKNIKAALLDQSITAGVGNWIADEILFQAGIYPTSSTKNLNSGQLRVIYDKMKEIMQTAIGVEAVREELPADYITRYGRKITIDCPKCKRPIEKTEVGGRGTYACTNCQVVVEASLSGRQAGE